MSTRAADKPNADRRSGREQFLWALLLAALTALTVGPLDALLNLFSTPLGDRSPDPIRADIILGAGLILTLICFGVLLAALLALQLACRPRAWPYRRISLILAVCPFAVLLKSSIGSFGRAGFGGPAARSAYIAAVVLTIAVLAYLAARGPATRPALARGIAWTLPALSLGALALAFQLMPSGPRPTGSAWHAGAAFCALAGASILGAAIIAYRLRGAIPWRAAALTALAGVAAAGLLGWLITPARSHKSHVIAGTAAGQRNVILISIDTLRADRLGAYGAGPLATPNIDRLAADGMVFENAYSPAPWTLPGIAALLTGMDPTANGTDCRPSDCSLSGNVVTLGERFRDAGYRTAAFGSNTNVIGRNVLQGIGEYRFGPFIILPQHSPGAVFLWRVLPSWFGEAASSADIAGNAIDWLQRNQSARFFLWVHFLDPHVPYSAFPSDPQAYPAARRLIRRSAQLPALARAGEVFPADWIETIKALYALETAAVDSEVGRFLDRLRELGLYDDAVIALTADHGEELWDHGGYEHGHALHEELLRVPLIVKAPTIPPGRTAARAATMQVPRTVLQAASLSAEDPYLAPPLPDGGAAPNATLLIGATLYFDRRIGIIFDDRKYIRNSEDGSELLFDLAADPEERRPLTDEQSLDLARRRLDERLERSMKLRELFVDQVREPSTVSPDLLRSLGYL